MHSAYDVLRQQAAVLQTRYSPTNPIFKYGSKTGLTIGERRANETKRLRVDDGDLSVEFVRVAWTELNFSEAGDSGCLVFRLVDNCIIPEAIHQQGDEGSRKSRGILLDEVTTLGDMGGISIQFCCCPQSKTGCYEYAKVPLAEKSPNLDITSILPKPPSNSPISPIPTPYPPILSSLLSLSFTFLAIIIRQKK